LKQTSRSLDQPSASEAARPDRLGVVQLPEDLRRSYSDCRDSGEIVSPSRPASTFYSSGVLAPSAWPERATLSRHHERRFASFERLRAPLLAKTWGKRPPSALTAFAPSEPRSLRSRGCWWVSMQWSAICVGGRCITVTVTHSPPILPRPEPRPRSAPRSPRSPLPTPLVRSTAVPRRSRPPKSRPPSRASPARTGRGGRT